MEYQADFDTWKERILAVSEAEIKFPNQPIDDCTAMAETLAKEASEDKDALVNAGLDGTIIDELPTLSAALRFCQANWMSEYRAQQEAQKEWLAKSPEAYELRDEILHHFSFAFRNEKEVKPKVARIKEGSSHADMIQDLVELAILGEKYPEPLAKVNYDVSLNGKAMTTSRSMSELLATANGDKDERSESKLLRDRAYTLLTNHMSTIREYGRYVFWKNEDRKEKYAFNYKG
ncbi:hypothetical protein [Marinifilum sp.]|uniref:hypothetical protein n=1 Tax=Marinifilum sp. TaxID=2033137 RepID=UPI003BAD70DD